MTILLSTIQYQKYKTLRSKFIEKYARTLQWNIKHILRDIKDDLNNESYGTSKSGISIGKMLNLKVN